MKLTKSKLKQIIKEEWDKEWDKSRAKVHSTDTTLEWDINRGEFKEAELAGADVYAEDDVQLIQDTLGDEYYVVDPDNRQEFVDYVVQNKPAPNEGEVVVPLVTSEQDGQRTIYFKTAQNHRYGKLKV